MIRSTLMSAAALMALAVSAQAPAHASTARNTDSRLVSRNYSEKEVVRIDSRLGVQASIAFREDEHIENVAIGDSETWQVTPNKRANLLFVKPLQAHARTNMTVVTDRHNYYFDLVASPVTKPIYVLRFSYPDDAKKEAAQQATANTMNATEALAVQQPVADPAQLNFAWQSKGKSTLLPARIYDDGQATYVSWRAGTPVPAILVRNQKGEEGAVNYAVRGDVIVIDDVPDLILLRSGRDSATLENKGEPRTPATTDASAQLAAVAGTQE